jgi:hypothetical protein
LTTKIVRYEAGQGADSHVTIQWCKGIPAKDTTTRTISPLAQPMCLTKEEVRGYKVEHEIILPPSSIDLKLIPGGVFDSQELLTSGTFSYLNWEQRKSYTLHRQGSVERQSQVTLAATTHDGVREEEVMNALKTLTDPVDCSSLPKRSSCSEMCWSTSQDGTGLNIGGSFFYMGLAETRQFSFSSDRFRYMYVYMFDQVFTTTSAERPSQATDLLQDIESLSEDALFLLEVKFGRRVYVIIESESALENYSNSGPGGLEWLIISAKLQQPPFRKKIHGHINIWLQTQDGSSLAINDLSQLQATIDDYFRTTCADNPIAPLSYKVSDLDGTPVSLLTTAFLDSQHGLTSPKARVQLREISLREAGTMDPLSGEEIYGKINLHLFHELGHQMSGDGHPLEPHQHPDNAPAGTITIANKESPLRVSRGKPQIFNRHASETYIDVDITSLDMAFQIEPIIKERRSLENHLFSSNTNLKMKLRQMLMEGRTGTTFLCTHDKCQLELTMEITPL